MFLYRSQFQLKMPEQKTLYKIQEFKRLKYKQKDGGGGYYVTGTYLPKCSFRVVPLIKKSDSTHFSLKMSVIFRCLGYTQLSRELSPAENPMMNLIG